MRTAFGACALFLWSVAAPTLSAFGAPSERPASITVKGSDTMVILAWKWAEAYMRLRPAVKVQVTGGGSGVGIAALQNQTTDLCDASRQIRPAEIAECIKSFGKQPTE